MLSAAHKRLLKSQAQLLQPHVQIGTKGVTPEVVKELELALKKHLLIKVRFSIDERKTIKELCQQIVSHTQSNLVNQLGKTASFYKAPLVEV